MIKNTFLDLTFQGPMEERYRENLYQQSIGIYRALALLGAILYGLFYIADLRDFPDTAWPCFIVRFMVVIPTLLLLFTATFSPMSKAWIRLIGCMGLLTAQGGVLALMIINSAPNAQLVYFGSTFLIIMATHSLIWQGYILNLATSLVMISGYWMVSEVTAGSLSHQHSHIELLLAALVFGGAANYFIESHFRKEFKVSVELRRQKRKAEEATRLKDKFVTLVSHDMKAPLSSVLGLLEFLKSPEAEDLETDRKNEILQNIHSTLEDQFNLISQLLKLSTLQTGRISVQKKIVHVKALVDQQIAKVAHLAEKRGSRILNEIPEDMITLADPALLGEVIQNLLSNSIKFTGEGGSISISSKESARNTIAIRDTGVGIHEDHLPNIFSHHVDTGHTTGGGKGPGLGLPYSHDLVTAQGGQIKVQSTPGQGSEFTITLPVFRRLVLLVDSESAHRRSMREMIEEEYEGVEIIEAEDGRKAMETIRHMNPDLMVTAVSIPRMDGFSLLEKIKSNQETSWIPVIMCAPLAFTAAQGAHVDANMKRTALSLGAVDFIVKPVAEDEFKPLVKRFLKKLL